jgi:hypothetical protein
MKNTYWLGLAARLRSARARAIGRVASRGSSQGRAPIPDNCEDWPFHQYLSLPNYETDRAGYPRVAGKHQVDPAHSEEE